MVEWCAQQYQQEVSMQADIEKKINANALFVELYANEWILKHVVDHVSIIIVTVNI